MTKHPDQHRRAEAGRRYPLRWVLGIIAVVWLGLLAPCPAAEEIPAGLTLKAAIQTALKQNPSIEAASAVKEAAGQRIGQAKSGLYPQIDFTQGFNRTTNPMWAFGTKLNQEAITQGDFDPQVLNDPDPINNFTSKISIQWPVFDRGQTWIGIQQAKLDRQAADRMLARSRQQVAAQTVGSYFDLLLARAQLAVVEKTLQTAQAHQRIVQNRHEGGLTVKSDLLRDVVHVAELEQQVLQAKNFEEIAQSVLNASMGIAEDSRYHLQTPLERGAPLDGPLSYWIDTALSKRPDYLHMIDQREIAQKQVDKERAAHLPSVSLVGDYELNTEDFGDAGENYALGVAVNLNLFSGNRISTKIKEAQASLKAAEARLSGLQLQVRVETQKAYLQSQTAWQRMDASEAAVRQADENLRIVKSRYENGLLTIVELLDAEAAFQRSQTNFLQAVHDHLVAKAQLWLAAGTLSENDY